ncbi:MAG TPA: hypothetical protein VI583_01130 [Cyclobacteriaceae bacterium]|nr:hypothetical protein [Cyclobacteriaceae bacterium]
MKNPKDYSHFDLLDLMTENHQQIHETVRLIKIIGIMLVMVMAIGAIIAGSAGA